jgi:Na+/H+-dicarboxylate symporter
MALLDVGFASLVYIARALLAVAASVTILIATYAIRIRAKGVGVRDFVKKILPLLRENKAINSAIDAAPYNIRFCARNLGMDRKNLSTKLPILAQLSLDGNCFLLMFIAMLCIFMIGATIHWTSIVAIAALVLFLELGAPNQPGGILVGALIIITYLNLPDMLHMAIYLEVLLGSTQNLINVISNIVTMVEDEGVYIAKGL